MSNISIFKERIKLMCKKTGISQKHLTDTIGRKNTYLNDVWNIFAEILDTTPLISTR